MISRTLVAMSAAVTLAAGAADARTLPAVTVENYVRPYVATSNFSGVVLVARAGKPMFTRAYGMADRERRLANDVYTRFHIASMSMQFTSAAVLRLVAAGKLSLDTPVSAIVPDYPNGANINIRHLLTQTSGIADINSQPDYSTVLSAHQTPASLVAKVQKLPPSRAPGTFDGEEHSAFNLLALIVERKTHLPFATAVRKLVFAPLGMTDSGIDDDRSVRGAAKGYQPQGALDVAPADRIHWSAKAGNGSAYTSALDEMKFVQGLFRDDFIPATLRAEIFDLKSPAGYGWFKGVSARFGEPVYSMNGRAPGFASAVVYVPREKLLVVVLSNIYASVPTEISKDLTAIALGKPYSPLRLQRTVDRASAAGLPAAFQFGEDFYQPSALVRIEMRGRDVALEWPNGDISSLIPIATDRYIDRAYWVPVDVVRNDAGEISSLKYDRFTGARARL